MPILSFDPGGTLVEITTAEQVDAQSEVEFFSGLLVPGFVNAHAHTELSYLWGKIPKGIGLTGFASEIARIRDTVPAQERVLSARYWDAKMYNEGISAVGDICNTESTFSFKGTSALRYHNFIESFGLQTTDFSRMESLYQKAQSLGLAASETPHSLYSLQDAPFRTIAARSKLLSVHFMESRAESELFACRGPLSQRNRDLGVKIDFARYGSPTQRLIASVPNDKKLLLIHNTFAESETIERIESHFTVSPTWVLAPGSNAYIEGAHPPAALLAGKGVHVAIGTDSLASNETLSMVEALKMLPEIDLPTRLRWATLCGAEALGLEERLGSFEVGKRPGATLITGVDWPREQLTAEATSRRIL